jgi:hypothetical protein
LVTGLEVSRQIAHAHVAVPLLAGTRYHARMWASNAAGKSDAVTPAYPFDVRKQLPRAEGVAAMLLRVGAAAHSCMDKVGKSLARRGRSAAVPILPLRLWWMAA